MRKQSFSFLLLAGGACLGLSACGAFKVGRDYTSPEAPEMSETLLQENNQGRYQAAAPVLEWWKTLGDEQLAGLVDKALRENLDVRVALANIEQARAIVNETEYDRFPTVTSSAQAARQYLSEEGLQGEPLDRSVTTYEAGFDAFWELDLFGRVAEGIAAEEAALEAREADLQQVYVTVAAEVARVYTELRGAQYRLDVANRNAENQRKTFDLISRLASGGRSNDLDVSRAQSQLDQTLSLVPPLEAEVNAAVNRLGVLTGQTPDALRDVLRSRKPIPSIPETVAVGTAQDLLKNRPDVRSAERELASSVARYNLNVADLYPRITLQGSFGFLATAASSLFTGGAAAALLAPTIDWPAFDIGRVEARIDAADAETRARLARFQQTVLSALEELDTSMVNFSREEQRRARLLSSARASARAADLARQRYEAGRDSFLDLLDAERRLLEAEDLLASSETQAVLNLISVYKALGGGWKVTMSDPALKIPSSSPVL